MFFQWHLGPKALNDNLDKCKSHGDKRGPSYINKTETPTIRGIVLVKGKEETPNQVTSDRNSPLCTYCHKYGHA